MTWVLVVLAFIAGLSCCYWKRAALAALLPGWHRPSKEPVDQIARRLNVAAERLEVVTHELQRTVGALRQDGATRSDFPSSRDT